MILPLVTLRRLDCVLAPTKDVVLAEAEYLTGRMQNPEAILMRVAKQQSLQHQ